MTKFLHHTILLFLSGSWLEFLQIDGDLLWKITDPTDDWILDVKNLLPSNSKFRKDCILIERKDWDNAQKFDNSYQIYNI